ncbi:MAG TPA: hypothetical protein DEW46_15820, partial [Verrucomicrobia bacterium]|nr:hypothetical protein [Verrucomicrobiota bacterium]
MGSRHETPGAATVLLRCSESQVPTEAGIDPDFDFDNDLTDRPPPYSYSYSYSPHHRVRFWAELLGVPFRTGS